MIKKVIAAALITAVAGSQADATVFNGFAVGVNGGVLIAQNKVKGNMDLSDIGLGDGEISKLKNANKTMGQFGLQFDYEMSKANSFYGRVGLVLSVPTGTASSVVKASDVDFGNGVTLDSASIKLSIKDRLQTEIQAAAGYNFCDSTVVYGLIGLNISAREYKVNIKATVADTNTNTAASGSGSSKSKKTKLAPVIGAGFKVKIPNTKMSAGAEYKFTKFKKIGDHDLSLNSNSHAVLARVSYHF